MLAEIITIGDELLIGQVVDTNSAWIGQELNKIGIQIHQITSVSDNKQHILKALKEAEDRVDFIFITGGLGPTKDDITKKTLCEYFDTELVLNDDVLQDVQAIFTKRGRELTEINRLQAHVPANCKVIRNTRGTAPGMWFTNGKKIMISMAGVPYEMKAMMLDTIIPMLKASFVLPIIIHKTILTQGIGESFLATMIDGWEDNLPQGMKLAYLPAPGMVRLRLSLYGYEDKIGADKLIQQKSQELYKIVKKYVYGFDDDKIEQLIGKLLIEKNATLSLAESCSGGMIASKITSIAGSSAYFMGSVVSYDNSIKSNLIGVNSQTLVDYGAVSEEMAIEMATNIRLKFNTDYAVATTGIAGPTGGSEEKPVGTVWISLANKDKCVAKKFTFGDNSRNINIELTTQYALHLLRYFIIKNEIY